ncbi:TetR/AcrR family transcriptional regulator [Novosphingobium album (ex Liu et al. 2023)]|uniref:TetR/AcrR family transcriptional regulator n=1 Tax=Novosphingobium album (ex Liu et al. 2023) TaxID=3031130 RepID=A0ABT5WQ90_9SPHN|nr:TetR/AcrR family transcriptional regulator [Novosphingobium album (ex Liu et al. 2023)]MDE8652210.1 TetR/AcrR family transcriptional regulator [Novosphingobium album (ex Liu et al. 2023)]
MVRHAKALARRKERTELRCEQVLEAAEACFRAEGFHGASMARIAETAGMSVGHIYSYFESKEAVIIALCERRFAGFEHLLTLVEHDKRRNRASLVDAWISQFAWWIDPERAPLTLEIMSEAGRNPKVSSVVRRIDRRFRDMMRQSLVPLAGPIPEDEIEDRLEALTMLAHGMTIRITADPDVDPRRLLESFRRAVHRLLAIPSA